MVQIQVPSNVPHLQEDMTIEQLINWLAKYGQTNAGGVTRLLYSPSWLQAQKALKEKMATIGLQTYFDSVGNLFGRTLGTVHAEKVILTGSHIDTVIQGGKYDGAYGIVASLLAVKRLIERYGSPKYTIEVVSLCEEEGSRFPLTYWGSKNVMGQYDASAISSLKDKNDVSFIDAMGEAGFPLSHYQSSKRKDVQHFVEVHIEQGHVLENKQFDIGIVSHIVGQQRYKVTFYGECNHAGTTEMQGRKDAMVCAANVISELTTLAIEKYPMLRATVGQLQAEPNVPNVIAGTVSFTVDIRHHEQSVIEQFAKEMHAILNRIDTLYQVKHIAEKWTEIEPVTLDEAMHEKAQEIVEARGYRYTSMVSGAGHDSQVFGQHIPTTLLFVPSQKGISHSPLEYTAPHHLENGVQALMGILYHLAYEGGNENEC